tara:strand:+ start:305 stop:535 length:231 start_codon:yes stop_codon:yes gene_type:complete
MGKAWNVKVTLDEVKGDSRRLIKKFIKKVKKERIIENYLDKQVYTKPSQKRRLEKKRKKENARKAERQRKKKLDIS